MLGEYRRDRGCTCCDHAKTRLDGGVWRSADGCVQGHGAARALIIDGGNDQPPGVCVQGPLRHVIALPHLKVMVNV